MSERFFQSEKTVLTTGLADFTRGVLPESVKKIIRPIVRKEIPKFPLPEPAMVDVGGVEAKFHIKTHSDWVRLLASNYGEPYEPSLIATIKEQENPVFVDVGSAQGVYSIPAAIIGAQVFSVDPDPVSSESMRENLVLNPATEGKVTMIPFALGNERGEVKLHIDRKGIYAPSLVKTVRGLSDVFQTERVRFDDLVKDGVAITPSIVKIDVEGAEGQVIEGMSQTLGGSDAPSDVFIELHVKYLPRFGSSPNEVREKMLDFGYTLSEKDWWSRSHEIQCHFRK